ncbi:hypothetical protein [uncultured Roseivirga sp.]|uniref:hypothetical protein n=1 Tax=uncultured Roseivirga sp. TaxID=543088 RepID=UPI0030D95592|tara:strand:- start:1996 stop:3186 length:1191 start_codon:yes stop_codon:yes gene_type:complete
MMKKVILFSVLLVFTLSACKDDDEKVPAQSEEGQFVRLMASDQDQANYYLINPGKATVETHSGQFANGRLYTSPSGRFVSVINTEENLATFFDSGIEGHDDHVHIKGTPKWALSKATASRPVHYYGSGDNILVFNDGEGSISHFKESTLHTEANARVFNVGVAHHGAPALFNNGTIAVTEKDGSAAGTLPERVKIIDMNGGLLHASTIQTGGIHGEAGNGSLVLFGCTDGILQVNQDGSQVLIPNPSSFGTNWIGTILYGKESDQFVGFKSKYGLYKIDVNGKTINAIEESADLVGAMFDWEGHDLLVLYTDGTVKVLDGHDFDIKTSKKLNVNFPATGTPAFAASEDFLYITDVENSKVSMYKKSNLELIKEISLPGKPSKIALMGSLADDEDGH